MICNRLDSFLLFDVLLRDLRRSLRLLDDCLSISVLWHALLFRRVCPGLACRALPYTLGVEGVAGFMSSGFS